MKWDRKASLQCSFLNGYIANDVMVDGLRKNIGKGYTYRFAIIKGKEWTGFSLTSEKEELIKFVKNRILREKNFIKKNIRDYYLIEGKSKKFFKELNRKDFNKLSNPQLAFWFKKFLILYIQFISYGPLSGQVISGAFTPEIDAYLQTKLNNSKIEKKDEYLSQLVVPRQDTIQTEQEKNLYKIAQKFYYLKRKLVNLYKKNNNKSWEELSKILSKTEPKFAKAIKQHAEKYSWLPVLFENPAWDELYFLNTVMEILLNQNISRELKIINQRKTNISRKKLEITKKFSIPPKVKRSIKSLEEYQYLKTRCSITIGFFNYNILPLYEEMAKRLNLSILDFKSLTPNEIEDCLKSKIKVPYKKIQERKKMTVLIKKNHLALILTGVKAKAFLKAEIKNYNSGDVSEVLGRTAYPGTVRGNVVVISTSKTMDKMKKNNILVTSMTSVDMMMVIKKAAAIVTDIGGLTCHAAIISREFGIPCIIGTKIASEVFKDGDLVEVNATKGLIKKI